MKSNDVPSAVDAKARQAGISLRKNTVLFIQRRNDNMITVAELEEQFKIKQNEANELAIRMSIGRQGINVDAVSRQDFDRVMRLNMNILDIREKANTQINLINQEAAEEHNKLVQKIQEALARYRPEAKITPVPVPEPVVEPATAPEEKEKETITPEDVGKAEEVLGTS